MRWSEVIQESVSGDIMGMVTDIIMTLKIKEVPSVPLSSVQQEIMKRYNIEVGYTTLINILNNNPMVLNVTEDAVEINIGDDISSNGEIQDAEPDPQDAVQDMALGGDYT